MTQSRSLLAKAAVLALMGAGLAACVAPVADPVAYSGYPAEYYPAYYDHPAYYGYPAYYPDYYAYPGYHYGPPAYYAYPPPVFYGSVFFRSGGRGHRH